MSKFEPITLTWDGKDYVIASNQIMGAISRIEDVVTLEELGRFINRGTVPLAKLCQAYATVLRYAGAKVSDEDVYSGMFGNQAQDQARVLASVTALMSLMIPPSVLNGTAPDTPVGNVEPTAASSSKRTRPRSGRSG